VGVLGDANNSLISGVLILRGQDHKAVVEVAPDWESYEYKKLDIDDTAEDKEFFEAALAWDLSINTKAWADGKTASPPLLMFIRCTDDIMPSIVQVIEVVRPPYTFVIDTSSRK
jgi:hypothetical protein